MYRGLLLLLFYSSGALAEWNWSPKYEIYGSEKLGTHRFLVKNSLNLEIAGVRLFAESFVEKNGNPEFANQTRSPAKGYLQEAYLDFRWQEYFLKIGRQANRWSEMWASPSLDIFTGHRYNRGFLDPLSEQLSHSSGVLFSSVFSSLISSAETRINLDLFVLWEHPESDYPEPLPAVSPEPVSTLEGGARAKLELAGHQLTAVAAKVQESQVYGAGWSWALDSVLPKLEVGQIQIQSQRQRQWKDSQEPSLSNHRDSFVSGGLDIFWSQWLVTPQMTWSYNSFTQKTTKHYYGNISWLGDRHEFLIQGSRQEGILGGHFFHVSYTYKPKPWWQLQTFWQNYEGKPASIFGAFGAAVGSSVVGLRVQMDYDVLTQ
jgi:hypothetical protein